MQIGLSIGKSGELVGPTNRCRYRQPIQFASGSPSTLYCFQYSQISVVEFTLSTILYLIVFLYYHSIITASLQLAIVYVVLDFYNQRVNKV